MVSTASVVLVNPITSGNIGAIARVMKNFSFKELILVDPKCNHLEKEAFDRASHADDILRKAKIMAFDDIVENFDYIVGTTSKVGTDYNIPRCPMTPEDFAAKVSEIKGRAKVAILFGNESSGLKNEDINKCDFVVAIPVSKSYPAMNISHACAVILYCIYSKLGKDKIAGGIAPITNKEKKQIAKMIDYILDMMIFDKDGMKATQKSLWKRIVGKSMMTRREAYAMMGFLKKIMAKKFK